MTELSAKHCEPCRGGVPPLGEELQQRLLKDLEEGWEIIQGHNLERLFVFDDFASALQFTNRVGEIAEREGHHPDIYLAWGKVKLTIWTHKIDGLTESDFILAAKAEKALHVGADGPG